MRKWIYGEEHGSPLGSEYIYSERFDRHNKEAVEYFKNRPQDLLVIDITKGDGWEKLCPFLNKDIPDVPFPKSNTAEMREARAGKKRFSIKSVEKKIRLLRDRLLHKLKS